MTLMVAQHRWCSEELLAVPSHGITSMTKHYRVNETWDETTIFRTSYVNLSFSDVGAADQLCTDLKKWSGIRVYRLSGVRLSLRCWEADGHTKIIEAVRSLRDVVLLTDGDDVMVRRAAVAHGLMLLRGLVGTRSSGQDVGMCGYELHVGDRLVPVLRDLRARSVREIEGVRWGDLVSYVVDTCGQRPVVTY